MQVTGCMAQNNPEFAQPTATYPSLNDTVVLVTGGGSGIGAEIVRQFAAQGAKVGFLDIAAKPSLLLQEELEKQSLKSFFHECDLTDIAALRNGIDAVRNHFGRITVLVNNAAHDERHTIEEVTPEYWDERMAINLKHQFFASQAVIDDMKHAGGGSIINMGSVSWMFGQGGMPGYTTAKAAVMGLTRSLARDLGPFDIRVNSVAPGWIMTERQIEKWLTPAGVDELMTNQCLKRKLQPIEIARPVLFLASSEASACTNQTFVVDGGWL